MIIKDDAIKITKCAKILHATLVWRHSKGCAQQNDAATEKLSPRLNETCSVRKVLKKLQTFSSKRLLQSSLESSELSISNSSHDAFLRCSQVRACAITVGGMRTTQAARPETRSLKSMSFSHSSVSVLYT